MTRFNPKLVHLEESTLHSKSDRAFRAKVFQILLPMLAGFWIALVLWAVFGG